MLISSYWQEICQAQKLRKIGKKPCRSRCFPVQLTIEEILYGFSYEIVSADAKNANFALAEYDRKQVLNKKVIVKYELAADLPELKKLIAESGKTGSNLNQITRHFNTGGIHSQEMRKAINQGIADIYEMK